MGVSEKRLKYDQMEREIASLKDFADAIKGKQSEKHPSEVRDFLSGVALWAAEQIDKREVTANELLTEFKQFSSPPTRPPVRPPTETQNVGEGAPPSAPTKTEAGVEQSKLRRARLQFARDFQHLLMKPVSVKLADGTGTTGLVMGLNYPNATVQLSNGRVVDVDPSELKGEAPNG